MYTGYIFVCNSTSFKNCLKNKRYACSGEQVNAAEEIETGAVVFLHILESDKLIGPFTVADEKRTNLQPGTWTSSIDQSSFSGNIKVEWEELHQLENVQEKFPSLNNLSTCTLSQFQTQELLDALKKAPRLQAGKQS
jgi:hypothetical protein